MPGNADHTKGILDGFDIFTGTLALLAFVMAFYALAARERKTPYITRSLYSTAFIFLFVLFLAAIARFLSGRERFAETLETLSSIILLLGVILVIYRVWKIQNSHMNLREDNLWKNIRFFHWVRSHWRNLRGRRRYEENPTTSRDWLEAVREGSVPLGDRIAKVADRARLLNNASALSVSIGCHARKIADADQILVKLARLFLEKDFFVQYATCTRHPFEFVAQLRKEWDLAKPARGWNEVTRNVVVVDAYSPHFAFTDAVHEEATKELKRQGIKHIGSRPSFAGLHTATTQAFNVFKERDQKDVRRPTLVIYDGPHALVDLESSEQYRIFVRHVIPSERQYGGTKRQRHRRIRQGQ